MPGPFETEFMTPGKGPYKQQCDGLVGLVSQDPSRGPACRAFSAAGDYQAGNTFVIRIKCSGTGPNFAVFSKNAPWKFVVLTGWTIMTGAGASSDTVKVQHGDGAGTESWTDITNNIDVSSKSDKDMTYFSTIDDAVQAVGVNQSLRAVTASSAAVDVYLMCMRVP